MLSLKPLVELQVHRWLSDYIYCLGLVASREQIGDRDRGRGGGSVVRLPGKHTAGRQWRFY